MKKTLVFLLSIAAIQPMLAMESFISHKKQNKLNKQLLELVIHLINHEENTTFQQIKELLDAGADVNSRDKYGQTPLHHANGFNLVHLAEFLIANGANMYILSNQGHSPLQ